MLNIYHSWENQLKSKQENVFAENINVVEKKSGRREDGKTESLKVGKSGSPKDRKSERPKVGKTVRREDGKSERQE